MGRNGSPRSKLEERASEILERGVILHLGMNRFRVSSQSQTDKYYDVSFLDAWGVPARTTPVAAVTAST